MVSAIEVALVGWLLSPIITKIINAGFDYLRDQPICQTGMNEELKRLQENHPKIQTVVSAASQAQKIDPDSALNKWIWQLRDAIEEADDVLDEFEYKKHEHPSFSSSINEHGKRALNIESMLTRLKEVVHKLDKISTDVSTFRDLLKDTKQEQQVQQDKLQNYRETGFMPKDILIGRGQHKDFVLQWLKKLPNEEHQSHVTHMFKNISLLSIVGPGGIGKTTLLQHVYEDESTDVFDHKMWVSVSNNFDSKKILLDMLESFQNTRPSETSSLNALQKNLKSKMMFKKFLLVLDDIWEQDEEHDKNNWENVLAPLGGGVPRSKILITTRMNSAALIIAKVIKKRNEQLILKGLEDDECLQLLDAHAFANEETPNDHKKLKSITKELVKKLSGSPLAAKVLGGALNSNLDERHWRNVLNNVLGHNVISSILELSYIFLPQHLKNCFAFCSIFTQDHIYDKDDLVRMWIAAGFIQPSNDREDVEDIGKSYFDILVKKSFFHKHSESKYKMHDLLYEVAKNISSQLCFRVVDDEDYERIPETIRHLSIKTDNLVLLKKMRAFKNLRTLCITYDSEKQDLSQVLTKFFKGSTSIRLLSICAYHQKKIPDEIECLKHLRYLDLSCSTDTLLPKSVSKLYHLQFLICEPSASHDDLFQKDMKNLSNLRYLRSPHFKFPEIGKLKFLKELNGFEVKNDSDYRIKELEHMNDLRILRIKGLENLTDVLEACNAKLCDKRELTDLSLEWNATSQSNADHDIYASVLDNLQPHNNLKNLTMKGYKGFSSAIWMNNVNLIKNLERIELEGCLEWQNLPPFGKLPFLKSLCLRDMPKAELPDLPPSLRELSLQNLDNLNSLPSCLPSLSSLTSLSIWKAPQLQELPDLPPYLRDLSLHDLDNLNCLPSCLRSLSSLTSLSIWKAPQLRKLPDLPPSLRELSLGFFGLDSLNCPLSNLPSLSSLTSLSIWKAPQLRELPDLPHSSGELNLENLDNLNYLPSCLPNLSSPTSLSIGTAPQLCELPDLPPSLRELSLGFFGLDNLNRILSCLLNLSYLTSLSIFVAPQLRELPDLPPSLRKLKLYYLPNLNCLPSCLSRLSSLTSLSIFAAPQLRELPEFPPSLISLNLRDLKNLIYLPSCLHELSSFTSLYIKKVPLQKLPEFPPSLPELNIYIEIS